MFFLVHHVFFLTSSASAGLCHHRIIPLNCRASERKICKYLSCPTLLTRRKTSFWKKNKQTNKQTEIFIIVAPGFDEINNQARWCWKQSSEICLLVLSRACDKKTSRALPLRNRTSNLRIPRTNAILLDLRDSTRKLLSLFLYRAQNLASFLFCFQTNKVNR